MSMKYIVGILALIILAGGAYLLWGETAQAPTNTTDNQNGDQQMGELDNTPTGGGTQATSTSDDSDTSDENATTTPSATITYTDDGFSPETVTITRGQAVEFVNESSRDFWPASSIHPTHTIYPEKSADDCLGSSFDACGGLAPGETYTFTFNDAGEWGYHDHLRANFTGTITVQE